MARLCDLGPMSEPDAKLLLEIVQEELKVMVDGGTYTEDPHRFESLAQLQTTLQEALMNAEDRSAADA